MTADDLSIHYQRIARGIAQQLHRDGVVHNAPCVWGSVMIGLLAADKTGYERAIEGSRTSMSDADAERLAELIKAREIYGRSDATDGHLRNIDFVLRLLAEARGCNPHDGARPGRAGADSGVEAVTWQPIETAPKCDVLLYFPAEKTGRNIHGEWFNIGRADMFPFRRPTHWQPLPTPPTEGEAP